MSALEGALGHAMARGDLESQEFGTAARADGGKPDYSLLPLRQLWVILTNPPDPTVPLELTDLIDSIADFQESGFTMDAYILVRRSLSWLCNQIGTDLWGGIEETIAVWEYGREKYAAFNWMKGMSWNSVCASYLRHIRDLDRGEQIDQESGRHHGAHLVCNAMMLVHLTQNYQQGNDLPTRWFRKETSDELGRGTSDI